MKLRIIPLGGMDEVGKNCTVFECLPDGGQGGDIIAVDLGFDFPGPDFPGVDYLLPDVSYLEKNKNRLRGIVLTHGHLDHIGAIPYLVEKLGNPIIYGTRLTIGLVQDRLKEVGLLKIKTQVISPDQPFNLGLFKINPFQVVHNIPDSVGLAIKTPLGIIIHTGDFKFDSNPADQKPIKKQRLIDFSKQGVLACLSDSTNAEKAGRVVSEKEVGKVIDSIIRRAKARVIFTTFSTLISRIQQVIQVCQKYDRKIAIAGLSIKKSVAIAQDLDYLTVPPKLFIDLENNSKYPDRKLLILAGGSQGVEGSSMVRIAQNEHRLIKIKKSDTIVFSSSAIPGNELAIHKVMNGIVDCGAKIIYQPVLGAGVHSSGHAFQEDLKEILRLVRPKLFIPIEGEPYMRVQHIELAKAVGIKRENCFMLHNGQILEINSSSGKLGRGRIEARILPKKVVGLSMAVEGGRATVLQKRILEIREKMAEAGVCLISISLTRKSQREIQIISKGLVIDQQTALKIKNKVKKLIKKFGLRESARPKIENSLSDFLLNKIGKRPLVIVV